MLFSYLENFNHIFNSFSYHCLLNTAAANKMQYLIPSYTHMDHTPLNIATLALILLPFKDGIRLTAYCRSVLLI